MVNLVEQRVALNMDLGGISMKERFTKIVVGAGLVVSCSLPVVQFILYPFE